MSEEYIVGQKGPEIFVPGQREKKAVDAQDKNARLVREYAVDASVVGDGRTVDLRIVPYNTPTEVRDFGGPIYTETWLPGAFEKQTRAANRVWLNFEHEDGLRGVVGHGVDLVERSDALYGSFRVLNGSDGDKALDMVNEGLLPGVSLEAIPLKSRRTPEGIVERVKARLDKVSLCRFPAFAQAQVLAVREGEPEPDEPAPEPPPDGNPPSDPERLSPQVVRDELAAEELAKNPPEFSDAELALQRIGYEPILKRAITRRPWDGSASRFDDEQWRRSCILDRGDQFDTAKTRYAFPVLEPSGDLNVNAMHNAAARLNQANATGEQKAAAARKLRRYYSMAEEDMPQSMMAMAGR